MIPCDICGKEFKTTQGLRGHKHFVHPDAITIVERPVARQSAQQLLGSNLSAGAAAEQRLAELEDRLANLERLTGLSKLDELEKLLVIADTPLTEQVDQLTEQLGQLVKQLNTDYVSGETMEAAVAGLMGQSEALQHEVACADSRLASAIHETAKSIQNSLSKIQGQSTTVADRLPELWKAVKHTEASVRGNRDSIDKLAKRLGSLEHTASEIENQVARVKNLARRMPTGEIVSVELNDKRERHFREYRSKEGLARPYRTTRDLLLGDRWIDLAEPED